MKIEKLQDGDKIRIETTLIILKDSSLIYVYPEFDRPPAEVFSYKEFEHLFTFLKAQKIQP